ncbi:MAG: C10 family peptidase, partial [Bacteroidota bacterium]
LSTYFNYDNKTIALANKTDYTTTDWTNLLKSELDASRPMYYSGSGPSGGHAWVCDGYNSANKFHMNWGWSGVSNGYYAIGALNTGNGTFNSTNAIVYGIKPGNPDFIVRFTNLELNNTVPYGPSFDINCSVVKGTPTAVNLYIDNLLVYNTTQTTFTYPWNTASAALGSHVLRVEAINATDTVFQEVNAGLSEWVSQASAFATASRGIQYVNAVDSLTVWATAYNGTTTTQTINEFTKTINGGTTWTPGQVLGGNVYGLGNICALSGTVAYVDVYSSGTQDNTCGVYKTSNGGTTWTHLTGALQGATSFADNVWFWNENDGMCHGDVKDNYFEIYTTSNGGTTWTRVPKTNIGGGANPISGEGGWTSVIQAVGASTIMFGTNMGNLYISHDKGLHWTISATGITPLTSGVQKIAFKDDLNGLVEQTTTSLVLMETHDGGATWQAITPTGPFLTSDLCFVPGTDNTFVSTGAASGATGASFSFDGGYTWAQFMGTETDQFLACTFVNDNCGYAGGFNTNATTKGMNKYVGHLVPGAVLYPVTNLIAQPFDNSVHLTWTEPSTPPLSYNVYRNDTLIANTPSLQYHDYPVSNGQQLYCVSAVYGLGESPKSCTTAWITVGVPNTDEAAYKVYPNPANEVINIVAPVKFSEVRMFNNMGQVVYTNNNRGTNLHILTAGFEPGMYILQINTGAQLISKKVSINR